MLRWVSGLLAIVGTACAAEVPPGFTLDKAGTVHDFDYFEGGWKTDQHKLKQRGVGSHDWEAFSATLCMTPYLGGAATVDEMYMPKKGISGLTLRIFDANRRQWSIYWVNSGIGKLDPVPTVGGFDGDHGEFYAVDQDDGRPVKVRYTWVKFDQDHARWEQAFSFDDRNWETNWTADFQRADAAETCDRGHPRH